MEFTPKQTEALTAVQSCKYDFILYGGAIRGGKTIWGLCTLLILCEIFPRSRWAVIRKDSERIRKTTIPSFLKLESKGKLRQSPYEYTHYNGSVILFMGENYDRDKDLDSFKGLEVNGFLFEEMNECQEKTLNKAFERSGTWIISKSKLQPKPIVLGTCNPTNGWVKQLIYDKWINGTLPKKWNYIPAKITDNPHLPQEYIDSLKNLPVYEYEVYVNGNWEIQLKTGGEFWKEFELNKHVRPVQYNESATLHISIDNNVYPYIAISIWQLNSIGDIDEVIQIDELPVKDPHNTATAAAKEFVKWANKMGYEDVVFVYGDQTTTQRNTIDDNKKSFLDKFTGEISKSFAVRKRIPSKNPPVALSGDFVNAIYENEFDNKRIIINETCKESINDYILTKQDKDGGILKSRTKDPSTGISYEEHGHFSDVKRYFITQVLKESFSRFKRRFDIKKEPFTIGGQITNRTF